MSPPAGESSSAPHDRRRGGNLASGREPGREARIIPERSCPPCPAHIPRSFVSRVLRRARRRVQLHAIRLTRPGTGTRPTRNLTPDRRRAVAVRPSQRPRRRESHRRPLPRCREVGQHLVNRSAGGELPEERRHSDPSAPNHRHASHARRVDFDPFERHHAPPGSPPRSGRPPRLGRQHLAGGCLAHVEATPRSNEALAAVTG